MITPKVKAGDVVETYQGRFFKVVSVKDGMYGRTGFHTKKAAAEGDDTAVKYLNSYGLGQLLPEEKEAKKEPAKKDEKEAKTDASS